MVQGNEKNQPWWHAGLGNLTHTQWEQLCDGCGFCCLHKLEDDETGEYHYTQLACHLLDTQTCQCSDYDNRCQKVPDCIKLTPKNYTEALPWLPDSCAYKRVAQGLALPPWHHLITGNRMSIHEAGASAAGKVQSAEGICEEDYQDYLYPGDDYNHKDGAGDGESEAESGAESEAENKLESKAESVVRWVEPNNQ